VGAEATEEVSVSGREAQIEDLARLVRDAHPGLDEAVKWRRLTFTASGDWHHWLCAIAASASGVSLTFHKGALLPDPAGLLRGAGQYVRHVPHDAAVAHPAEVRALLREAVAHQKEMLG
jgi:hypothetical protein